MNPPDAKNLKGGFASLFPTMRRFDVHEPEQPAAYKEGYEGVDEGVGEDAPDGVLAQFGNSEAGQPPGGVSEEVVTGDGEASHLGQENLLRCFSAHGAGAG